MIKKTNSSYKLLALFLIVISCTTVSDKKEVDTTYQQAKIIEAPIAADTIAKTYSCYQGIIKNDTVSLRLTISNYSVTGSLAYNYYEKDSNIGIINGILKGDTLIANYKFQSEGVQSEREVVFLTMNNIVREGYGDAIKKNGVQVFKDKSKLNFSKSVALQNVDCQ